MGSWVLSGAGDLSAATESLEAIVAAEVLCSVALPGPRAFTCFVAVWQGKFVAISDGAARHMQIIRDGVTTPAWWLMFDSHQRMAVDNLRGLQWEGSVDPLRGADAMAALDAYIDRYPAYEEWRSLVFIEDNLPGEGYRIYSLNPEHVQVFDEARLGDEGWLRAAVSWR